MKKRPCRRNLQYGSGSKGPPVATFSQGPTVPSTRGFPVDHVLTTPGSGDEVTFDSEGSARDLGSLTQETEPLASQSLVQRESTAASQAARPEIRPSTSKHMEPKLSWSRDARPCCV